MFALCVVYDSFLGLLILLIVVNLNQLFTWLNKGNVKTKSGNVSYEHNIKDILYMWSQITQKLFSFNLDRTQTQTRSV